MAKQRYNYTGVNDLSYAKSEVPYVAPPTKEILGLLRDREDQYITTKNNLNLATELRNSLPYNPVSKGLYDEVVQGIDKATSSITPDNYADKALDSRQVVFDAVNVMGGKQLKEQQDAFSKAAEGIKAFDGIRADKKEWKARQLAESLAPITKNENGTFNVPALKTPKLIPDQDLHNKALKTFKDWKSNGMYIHNANGTLTVNKDVIGQFGVTKQEFADEKELYNTITNYIVNDPSSREFIDDEADFATSKMNITPESILETVPKETLAAYFPDAFKQDANGNLQVIKKVTTDDIEKLTNNNPEYLKAIAAQGFKNKYVNSVGRVGANTLGFTNDTMTFFEDKEYAESVKAKYSKSIDNINGSEAVALGDGVIPLPTTTMQIGNPTAYASYDKLIEQGRSVYVEAKLEYDRLTQQMKDNPDREVELKETRKAWEEKLAIADTRIQEAKQAQFNLTKGTIQLANDKNIPIIDSYKKDFNIITQEVNNSNKSNAMGYGYAVDISNKKPDISTDKNGSSTVTFDLDGDDKKENVPVYTEEKLKNSNIVGHYATRKGNKVTLYYGSGSRTGLGAKLTDKVIKSVGLDMLQDNPYRKEGTPGVRSKLTVVPTEDEFTAAVSKYFMNPKETVEGLTPHTTKLAKEAAFKLSKVGKASDIKVTQTLDYLYVPTTVKKGTAAYNLLQLSRTIDNTLISSGAEYKVVNSNGEWEDLPLFLKSKGLPYEATYIDFKNTRSGVMLTSDRQYGQKIYLPLKLTKEGMDLVKAIDPLMFDNSGTMNLTIVNKSGKNSPTNLNIVDGVTSAYQESLGNTHPSGDAERAAYGLIKFDNHSNSTDFYNLNLYTLPSGGQAEHTLPNGEKVIINAVKKSSRPDKLGDNDFYLTNENKDIFAYDTKEGIKKMVPYADYFADKTASRYKRTLFASPEDIGSLIGQQFLYQDVTRSAAPTVVNGNIKTTGDSYSVQPSKIKSANYGQAVDNTIQKYGKEERIYSITNLGGQRLNVKSKIDPSRLTNVSTDEYLGASTSKGNKYIKAGVYPYFNNSIVSVATKVIKDYGLFVTDAFRPSDKNSTTRGSAEDSLHQYGKSFDSSYNKNAQAFLAKLENNPQLANDLGIGYAFKHIIKGVAHLHIDFK